MFIRKIFNLILKHKQILIALGLLFLVGLFLRLYLISSNLFFGPEQGRDMLVVKNLVLNHKLVLIGPRTAIDGIFHGPLYFYLAAIPFMVSKGNPLVIEYFFIILNCLAIFPLYLLTKELFNKKIALISSVLFVFSFGAIVMSRWLSHPPLIIPFASLFFLFLVKFLKGKNNDLLPTAIFFGLVSQIEFTDFLIFSFILMLVVIAFWKRFISQKIIYLLSCIIVLSLFTFGNFLLFDIRHNFLISNSFLGLLTKNTGFYSTFSDSFLTSIKRFIEISSDTILPSFQLLTGILILIGILALLRIFKSKEIGGRLLLIWLFSPLIAFMILKYNPLYHYFAAIIIPVIILTAFLLDRSFSFNRTVMSMIICLFIALNLYALFVYLPDNKNVFFQTTQPDLKYSDQVTTIAKIYKESNNKPFYFQAYTIPYWLQEGWEYLFWYYGSNYYKYIPENKNAKLLFVIIQKDHGNATYQNDWLKNTVGKWGTKIGEFNSGALRKT